MLLVDKTNPLGSKGADTPTSRNMTYGTDDGSTRTLNYLVAPVHEFQSPSNALRHDESP